MTSYRHTGIKNEFARTGFASKIRLLLSFTPGFSQVTNISGMIGNRLS
jgi:hypothetical protein